jgi:hypothetical protein
LGIIITTTIIMTIIIITTTIIITAIIMTIMNPVTKAV